MKSIACVEKHGKQRKNREQFFLESGINRFPERLKEAMNQAGGLTNLHLAEMAGMSEGVIRKYLKGESYPTLDRLVSIASVCNCDVSWLATGKEVTSNIRTSSDVITGSLDPLTEQFINVVSVVNDEVKKDFLKLIYTKGIEGILAGSGDLNTEFMQLSEQDKAQLLRLHEQVKRGASVPGEVSIQNDPTQQKTGSS